MNQNLSKFLFQIQSISMQSLFKIIIPPKNFIFCYSKAQIGKKIEALSILGLDGSPSVPEIKRAFFSLSMKYHPDKAQSADCSRFQEVLEAYTLLKDIYGDEERINDSFEVKESCLNNYDGKLNEEDLETYKKYHDGKDHEIKRNSIKMKNVKKDRSVDGRNRMEEFWKGSEE